jgi:hypothetical protein
MREGSIDSTPRGQTADSTHLLKLQKTNREGLTADEPKATPRDNEVRLVNRCELFGFQRTD